MTRAAAKAVARRAASARSPRPRTRSSRPSIFDFELLPGDRFTETEIAQRLAMSRTPVREALYRLEREGYLDVHLRVGWSVRPFDFEQFEDFYDLRLILELAAVARLCDMQERAGLDALKAIWLVPAAERLADARRSAALDEAFHSDAGRGRRQSARSRAAIAR